MYCCRLYGTVHARELKIQGFECGLMPWCWCGSALVPMNSAIKSFPSICSELMFDGFCLLCIIHNSSKSVNLVVMSHEPRCCRVCVFFCSFIYNSFSMYHWHPVTSMSTYNYPHTSRYVRARGNSPSRIRGTRKDGLWHRALGLLSILASKTLAPVVTTLNAVPCWHQGHRLAPMRIFNTNGGKEGNIQLRHLRRDA